MLCCQIITNFRQKATGQLRLATCVINMLGSLIRIFTSVAEGTGAAMVRTYIISE